MKLLQVTAYETPGARFNGLRLTPALKSCGIDSRHVVWEKDTQNPDVLTFGGRRTHQIKHYVSKVESALSLQSVLYPHAHQLIRMPAFQEADVIHMHIIHNGYMSMRHLAKITKLKPTVWTLHDPWALTGHCIHPLDCNRWMTGCGKCPDLETPLPLKRDTTKWLFKYKKKSYEKANFDLVVTSDWMLDMVKKSPMFEGKEIHKIPFGVDLNFFSPKFTNMARKRFSIPDENVVLCFRADTNLYKGFKYIVQALEALKTEKKLTLIAINSTTTDLAAFSDKHQIIEFPWTDDAELIRDAIAASDIFLMPSLAESFGLMAVEAMACAKPTIVFDGTALESVTSAPDIGCSVPKRDYLALSSVMKRLIDDPDERKSRGLKGRLYAESNYCELLQAKRLNNLYKQIHSSSLTRHKLGEVK